MEGNIEELLRRRERRPKATPWAPQPRRYAGQFIVVGRNDPVRDTHDSFRSLRGFKVRICIEGEKELQVLGCGWRIVTCQFRGNKVLLHHNGYTATMKRPAFKALIAASKRLRRKRPVLRLVVSNPPPVVINAEAA